MNKMKIMRNKLEKNKNKNRKMLEEDKRQE
jgi:hypothetical protein